jgi:hypothetical protein
MASNRLFSLGTVAVTAGSKIVTLTGATVAEFNMRDGDDLQVLGRGSRLAIDVLLPETNQLQLLFAFDGATGAGLSYTIYRNPAGWGSQEVLAREVADNVRLLKDGIPISEEDLEAVEAARLQVEGNAGTVAADRAIVAADKVTVAADKVAAQTARTDAIAAAVNIQSVSPGTVVGAATEGQAILGTEPAKAINPPLLARALDVKVGPVSGQLKKIADQAIVSYSALVALGTSGYLVGSTGYYAWSFFADAGTIGVGKIVDRLRMLLTLPAAAVSVHLNVYRRPLASASVNVGPGAASDDILLHAYTFTPAALALTVPYVGATAEAATFDIDPIYVETGYTYGFEVEIRDAGAVRLQLGTATQAQALGTIQSRERGKFRVAGGAWTDFGSANRVHYALYSEVYASMTEVAGNYEQSVLTVEGIERALTPTDTLVASTPFIGTNFVATSNFNAFSVGLVVGTDVTAGKVAYSIGAQIGAGAGAVTGRMRIYARPVANSMTDVPGQPTDILVDTVTRTLAQLGLAAGGAVAATRWPLSRKLRISDAYTYIVTWEFLDGAGSNAGVFMGIGRADPTGKSQVRRGWYRISSTTTWTPTGTTASFHVAVYQLDYVAAGGGPLEPVVVPPAPSTRFGGKMAATGYAGRMELAFDNTVPKTHRAIFTTAQHFDAVRVIFGHGGAAPLHVAKFAVAVLDDPANYALAGVTWVPGTSNGAADATVPARKGVGRRGLLRSDIIPISSLTRADGATKCPFIAVAAYGDTQASLTLIGKADGTTNLTPWATHPTRPRLYRYNDGDCVSSPASFTSTDNRSTSFIVGVEYLARGRVVGVAAVGDSISNGEGSGITYPGATSPFLACVDLSDLADVCYDFINWGWSGVNTTAIKNQVLDVLEAGIVPEIMFIPTGSPNDIATTIVNDHIDLMKKNLAVAIEAMEARGVEPAQWLWLPSNTVVKAYGATDSVRVAYNDAKRLEAGRGIVVMDADAIIAGAADGSGQIQMNAAYESDGIHPDDPGHAVLMPLAKNTILALQNVRTGSLIAA